MRTFIQAAAITLAIIVVWYGIWSWLMAADVARVKASITHQYQAMRTTSQVMSLEADEVSATGFPFGFAVKVKRATLSMVDGDETFAISIPEFTMESADSDAGTYRVNLPATVQALYAKMGGAPEHYSVTMSVIPKLNLSASDSAQHCGPLTGHACDVVAKDAPLVSYALEIPKSITLHMQLGNDARDAEFTSPMAVDVPIYQPIPNDLRGVLQLAVGTLREALVFKTR